MGALKISRREGFVRRGKRPCAVKSVSERTGGGNIGIDDRADGDAFERQKYIGMSLGNIAGADKAHIVNRDGLNFLKIALIKSV